MGTSPESALTSFDLDLLLGPASASIHENTELSYKVLDTEKFEPTHYGYRTQTVKKSEANYLNQSSDITNYDFLAQNTGTSAEYQYQAGNLSNDLTTSNFYQIQANGNEFSLQVDGVSNSQYAALENKFVTLSNNYVSLKNENDALKKDYSKVQRQFANLAADYAKLHELNKEHAMESLNATSKCEELEKQILNYKANIKALQEHCDKLDLDIYAQNRQFVQYQSLVDELQTKIMDLKTEVKNEKMNGRDGRKMISVLTNNNEVFTEHLCLFACIIEGRIHLDKESRLLLKKYCKKRNKKFTNLDSIENQSIDTGRASSLASSDGEGSFLSPAYSFNFSPFSSSSIIIKPTKDASSSPPPGVKTRNIATSPIIFEERLSVPLIETCGSEMLEDNTWNISSSHIQLKSSSTEKTTVLTDAKAKPIDSTSRKMTMANMTPIKTLDNATNLMKIDLTANTISNPKTLDMSTGSIEFTVSIPAGSTISDATSPNHNDTLVPNLKQLVAIKNVTNTENKNNAVVESKMTNLTNPENNDAEVKKIEKPVAKTNKVIISPQYFEAEMSKSKISVDRTITNINSYEHIETEVPKSKKSVVKTITDITSPDHLETETRKAKISVTSAILDITSPELKETEVIKSKMALTETIKDINSPEHKETQVTKSKMTLDKIITDITSPEHKETQVTKSKMTLDKIITDITSPEHKETQVTKSKMTLGKTITDITSLEHKETKVPKSKKSVAKTITDISSSEHKDTETRKTNLSGTSSISDITSPELNETEIPKSKMTLGKTITDITSPEHKETEVTKSKMTLSKTITDIISPEHKETKMPKSKKSAVKIITDISSPVHKENEVSKPKMSLVKTVTNITSAKHKETEAPKSFNSMAQTIKSITSAESNERPYIKSKKSRTKSLEMKEPVEAKILNLSNPNQFAYSKTKDNVCETSKNKQYKTRLSDAKSKLSLADGACTETRVTRSKTALTSPNNQDYSGPRITRSKLKITSPTEDTYLKLPAPRHTRSNTTFSSPINHINASRRITRSYSAITSLGKNLDYKDRRVIFTNDISVLCQPIDRSELITKPKILDVSQPTESSVSQVFATPTKTSTVLVEHHLSSDEQSSEGTEIESLAVKHKSEATSPIAHIDTARLTRSRSKTLNISLISIESISKTRKTRSKTNSSVVDSDSDPRTPVQKSIIGFTSPIKSSNIETPESITRSTRPKKHAVSRRSLFKESDSEMDTSPERKTILNKKAQKRTRRVTRSNSSSFSLTENNDLSTRITRSKSGITSPLMLDIRTLSELKTGDTKTNMAKMKTSDITNDSCEKRTPLVEQNMGSIPPAVHLNSRSAARSKTGVVSPVKRVNIKSSESDSVTAKPSPIQSVGLRSPAPKLKTGITCLIEHNMRPSLSEFETDNPKTNIARAKSPDVTTEIFDKRTINTKSKMNIMSPVKFMDCPSQANSMDTTPSVMQSDSVRVTKSKINKVSPVMDKTSDFNSITPVSSPIQSIDFRSPMPKSKTGFSSPIELAANVKESMTKSKKDYNESIENPDTIPCMHKTKEIIKKPENMVPKNTVDSNCDTRPIEDNVASTISVAHKETAKQLKEVETLLSNNYDNDADNDLEINMILRKYSIDWAMLSPLSLSPVDQVRKHFKSCFKDDTAMKQNKVNDELIESLHLSDEDSEDDVNREDSHFSKSIIKIQQSGTVMEQNKVNDELIESLHLSDEDSGDDVNREDGHFSESIIENQLPVARDVDFGKINSVVDCNMRDSRFEDDIIKPLDKCPARKTHGNKYKKLTKLQKIYKANVRKNIQLSPTINKSNKPKLYSISPYKLAMIVTNKEKVESSPKKMLFKKPDAHVKVPKEKIYNKETLKKNEPAKTIGESEPNGECRLSCIQRHSQPNNNLKTTECNSRETSSGIRSSFSRIRTNPSLQCGRKKQLNVVCEYIKSNLNIISENENETSVPLESISQSDISNTSFAIPSRKRISRVTKPSPDLSSIQTDDSDNTKEKSDLNHNDFDSKSPPRKKNKVVNAEIETEELNNLPTKNKFADAEIETMKSSNHLKKNKVANAEMETLELSNLPRKNKIANGEIETISPSNLHKKKKVENEKRKPSIPPQKTECIDIEILSSQNSTKEHQQFSIANNTATFNDSNCGPENHCGNIKTTKVPVISNFPPTFPQGDHSRHYTDYNDINMFSSQNDKSMNDVNQFTSQNCADNNDVNMFTSQNCTDNNDINMFTNQNCADNNDINMFTSQNDTSIKKQSLFIKQWSQNILDCMILKYGSNLKSFKKPEYNNDLGKQIEKSIANCVKHSRVPDKYCKSVQEFANEMKSLGEQRIICGLMAFLKDPTRKKEIPTVKRFHQNEPTVTKTEMVLIDLIESLENSDLSLWELVLDSSEYILFTLEKGATPTFDVVDSVAHFYANVCKYLRKTSRLWMFMLNAMYCLSFKAIPLIKHCLDVKPNLLPYADRYIDPGLAPVVRCFVFLLHFYNCVDPFKRVEQLRVRLRNMYYYKLQDENETTIMFMVKQCISNLPDRKLNRDMLELVLLILAKRHGTRWCHKNIVQKILLPMIKGEIDVSYAGKRFCISTIGNIVKPYKNEMTVYSEEVVNLLLNMFETTLLHEIKEDIIRSLINMHMKTTSERIDKCLLNWNPPAVSPELELVLKDYVQSKHIKAWQLMHINQLN